MINDYCFLFLLLILDLFVQYPSMFFMFEHKFYNMKHTVESRISMFEFESSITFELR